MASIKEIIETLIFILTNSQHTCILCDQNQGRVGSCRRGWSRLRGWATSWRPHGSVSPQSTDTDVARQLRLRPFARSVQLIARHKANMPGSNGAQAVRLLEIAGRSFRRCRAVTAHSCVIFFPNSACAAPSNCMSVALTQVVTVSKIQALILHPWKNLIDFSSLTDDHMANEKPSTVVGLVE